MREMASPFDQITKNSIYQDLQAAERYTREVYEKTRHFVIITGPPGLGKTTLVRRVCEEFGRKWQPIKPGTVGGFIDLLRNNRFEGVVLVGDDTTDSLWDERQFLNIMKTAYDTQHDRRLRHDVLGTNKVPPFPIKSALILLLYLA
jgi:hypothetical protein